MKRILTILAFLLVCSISYGQVAGATVKGQKPDGSFDWIQLDADKKLITSGSSTGGGAGTYTLILPAIASAAEYSVVLATSTATTLSSIASFSDGDLIMFQGASGIHWSFGVKTAAELQSTKGFYEDGLNTPQKFNLRIGTNMSFCASRTGIATFVLAIVGQQ